MTRWMLCLLLIGACTAQEPSATVLSGRSPRAATGAPVPSATPPAAPVPAAAPAPAAPSLFERLGGLPAIEAVVNDFVGRTTTDPRIKERFFNTDATRLKKMLVEQVCQATGGPCAYSGRDMRATHGGMELVDAEWDALVEDLVAALDTFSVPEREKGELIGALAGMKPDVVAPRDQLRPLPRRGLARAAAIGKRLRPARAAELVALAVVAGRRGQRSYAEQLFSRAELLAGVRAVASIAPVFRHDTPPRVTATPRRVADGAPQPSGAIGSSEDDDPPRGALPSSLDGTVLADGAPLRGFGVVMLTPSSGPYRRRTPKQRVIEQRGRVFAPRVMAVPVGSTIAFPNFDPFFHNVFSLSAPAAFDLGLYPSGEAREVTFRQQGIVRLGCNLHSAMAAFIIVVSAPHYAVTDGDGRFAFRRLTPGSYRLQAWSERSATPTEIEIVIDPGANRTSVALAADADAGNPDKFGRPR